MVFYVKCHFSQNMLSFLSDRHQWRIHLCLQHTWRRCHPVLWQSVSHSHNMLRHFMASEDRCSSYSQRGSFGKCSREFSPSCQSLNTNCSLVIQNVSARDAGLYTCRQWRSKNDHNFKDTDIYLHVLSSESHVCENSLIRSQDEISMLLHVFGTKTLLHVNFDLIP